MMFAHKMLHVYVIYDMMPLIVRDVNWSLFLGNGNSRPSVG